MSPTDELVEAIQHAGLTRDGVADLYRKHLHHEVNWPHVNQMIIDRWSKAGLRYIKKEAYR